MKTIRLTNRMIYIRIYYEEKRKSSWFLEFISNYRNFVANFQSKHKQTYL